MSSNPIHKYTAHGSIVELWKSHDREILLSGPAGTGKTRGILEKLHNLAMKYPRARILIVRKTQESLSKSALVEFQESVVADAIESGEVKFFYGSPVKPAEFQYLGSGSVIVAGGMDKASKVKSTQWDIIYANEADELSEDDWEVLTSRLRNNKVPYQQIIGDCNPNHPLHWLKQRADSGRTKMIYCHHEDNPTLYQDGDWTPAGNAYMETLRALTGVRKQRLLYGKWVAAEGLVYEEFSDPKLQPLYLFERKTFGTISKTNLQEAYTWYWSVDFGFNEPFVCQVWAMDKDDHLHLMKEFYQTGLTIEDAADLVIANTINGNANYRLPRPTAVICDSSRPDDIEYLRKKTHLNVLPSKKGKNSVANGINLVKERFKVQADGKPRICFNRFALYKEDEKLAEKKKPTSTITELPGYTWDRNHEDMPLQVNDHGMDAMRYMVSYLDNKQKANIRFIQY